jgi:hypothetical protein
MIDQVSEPRWRDHYYYWSQSVLILDLVGEDKRGTGSVVAGTRLCGNEESVKRDQRPVSPVDKNFQPLGSAAYDRSIAGCQWQFRTRP